MAPENNAERALILLGEDQARRVSQVDAWSDLRAMIDRAHVNEERAARLRVAVYRAIWPEHSSRVF